MKAWFQKNAGKGTKTPMMSRTTDTVNILGAEQEECRTPSLSRGSHSSSPSRSEHAAGTGMAEIKEILQNLPSKAELAIMLTKLESSVQEQLSTLTSEVKQISNRVGDLEDNREKIMDRLLHLEQGQERNEAKLLYNMQLAEDLDNRGRRNNIRVRGLPEAQGMGEDLHVILQTLFNRILQRPENTHIIIDRAQRVLKPRA
ncbi:Hypothetical predicted protein [Pelobates cultripes]|uniref:Uncharacterized protein n=1 Tax=Pelobates cultripes TaxID=61616 RepID=A0AAD1W6F1_PELCU|nr:Hypothetical predicted protein [Pelobates cultripes]